MTTERQYFNPDRNIHIDTTSEEWRAFREHMTLHIAAIVKEVTEKYGVTEADMIDWIIGGGLIVNERKFKKYRVFYTDDHEEIVDLARPGDAGLHLYTKGRLPRWVPNHQVTAYEEVEPDAPQERDANDS